MQLLCSFYNPFIFRFSISLRFFFQSQTEIKALENRTSSTYRGSSRTLEDQGPNLAFPLYRAEAATLYVEIMALLRALGMRVPTMRAGRSDSVSEFATKLLVRYTHENYQVNQEALSIKPFRFKTKLQKLHCSDQSKYSSSRKRLHKSVTNSPPSSSKSENSHEELA